MPMMWGFENNGFGMMLGWVIMSLFWLGVLAIAAWALVRWLSHSPRSSAPPRPTAPQPQSGPSALDLLNARYARGEIDTETYRSMRAELEATARTPEREKATLTI